MAARGSFLGSLVLGLLFYGCGAFALLWFDIWQAVDVRIPLSPRDTLAAAAGFYLLLAVIALLRRVGLRALGIFVGRCTLHVVLVVATAAVLVTLQGMQAEQAVGLSLTDLPPLVVLQMLSVAMSLAPLAVPRPRTHDAKSKRAADDPVPSERARPPIAATAPPPASRPAAVVAPPPHAPESVTRPRVTQPPIKPTVTPPVLTPPPAVKPSAVTPAPVVASPPVVTPRPMVTWPPVVTPPPLPATPVPPAPPAPPLPMPGAAHDNEGARREAPIAPPAEPFALRLEAPARPAASEPAEEMVRISFERVAPQLPADAFRLPLDRIAANLLEPGHLLVPRRLLAPQLGEGRARVPWSVVADQFPRQALTVSDADLAARLPDGQLALPLDEVIRQLPADVFTLSSPVVDVRGIEDFPLPFQPHVPPPAEEHRPLAAEVAPARREPALEPERPAPVVRIPEPEREPEPEPEPVMSIEPVAEVEPEPDPEPAMAVATEPEIRIEPESEPEPEADLVRFAAVTERDLTPSAFREPEPPRMSAPFVERRRRAEPSRIAALLKPLLSALEVQEQRVGRLTVLSVASPELVPDAVVASAAALAPLLDDRRLPAPATQATVRGAQGTVVLTPLGLLAEGAPLLAVAVAPGSPLAHLERVALRAVEAGAMNGGRSSGLKGYADDGGDLRDTAVPPHVRTLGESLRAFGPVVPTVLQDRATSLICYMFLAPGVVARPLAQYARDLREAMRGSTLGPLESFIVRMNEDRLVVREVDAGRGAAALVVAGGGPVDRLGLARLELERAVTRLAVR